MQKQKNRTRLTVSEARFGGSVRGRKDGVKREHKNENVGHVNDSKIKIESFLDPRGGSQLYIARGLA
jgi:hypothetical protein